MAFTKFYIQSYKIDPTYWRSGDHSWSMDLIFPFSDQQEATKELREKVFEDNKVMILQPAPNGQDMAVVEW
ncbi:toxin-activating lysine-acyltransferase [Sneathiella sp. P13V-1]|uniref:toxin-activating lysine-acyltransferase n=1 Tax=Sneathiella sp. P13V-1 TaxID=2697366 RepID=UPI00187BACD7|nr:toxin-activating lysine-acyltransferase [Sneathiella sp. P13V-1]MBE7637450.1 toxin-activating lysine-acyltransferase [Sneathiella sp. P13V-1]